MNDRVPLLILGLGNVLLGDDGVGSAAVASCATSVRLRRQACMSWTAGRSASPCFRMWRRPGP